MTRLVLLLALAVLAFVACRETESPSAGTPIMPSTPLPLATPSDPSTPEPATHPTTTPVPPIEPDPTAVVTRGGRLTISSRTVLDDLDVHRSSAPALAAFGPGIVYSRLLRFASGPEVRTPSLAIECDLCESWAWEDSTTLRVSLRDGVRWHDAAPVNGRGLTPQDVMASLARQRTAGWPNAGLLANLETVHAEGSDLVFALRAPDADFPLALADGMTKVLPRELLNMDDLSDGPFIGTGPWLTREVSPDLRYVFLANPAYFEQGLPYLDTLVIRVMPDDALRRAAFLTRSLDADEVDHRDWAMLQERQPGIGFARYAPPGGGVELALNVEDPGLEDDDVRRALFYALDPWALNGQVWNGFADVTGGMPSPSPEWRLSEAELRQHLADPAEARELLQGSGNPAPALELLVADFGDTHLVYSQGIQEQLRSVGVQATVTQLNPTEYADRVWRRGDFQAYLGPLPPLNAPNTYLVGLIRGDSPGNKTGYASSALDDLVEEQAVQLDAAMRRDLARKAALMLLEQGVRFTPAAPAQVWSWWPQVKGLHVNFANREYHFWSRVRVE